MSQGIQYAGEFNLEEALLLSPSGESTNLITDAQIVEINIFEDIFKFSISGSIIIADTNDIITKLPIMGQERLSLKLSTPSLTEKKDIIDFTENHFMVNRVNSRIDTSVGNQIYELSFVSPELVLNNQKRVSKSYVNTKANIGDIVFDLLAEDVDGLQTSKEVIVEETVGTRAMICSNSNPFGFIKRLTKEAVSREGSPHYLFFENKHGYNFKSLQTIFKQEIRGQFHGGDKGVDEENQIDGNSAKTIQSFKRMIDYNIKENKDLLVNSASGMFGGKVIEHNIYGKSYKVKTFNYFDDEDFKRNKRIDDNRGYSENALGSMTTKKNDEITNSTIHFIPASRDSNDNDANFEAGGTPTRHYETLLDRQSRFTELLDGISITMTIHGQTTLTVGDMVEVIIPSTGVSDDPDDKFHSGQYMIKKLRHVFSPPTKSHEISMEVIKDGLPEKLKSSGEEISKKPPTTQPKTPDFAAF